MEKEIKGIPGLPERFASEDGKIYRKYLDRLIEIHPSPNNRGYLRVGLHGKKYLVHRLILLTFVGPCPNGCMGLHKDDNPLNCNLSNLYWGTRHDNYIDMLRNGNHPGRKSVIIPAAEPPAELNIELNIELNFEFEKSESALEKFHRQYNARVGEIVMTKIINNEKINIIELSRIFSNKTGNCAGYQSVVRWIRCGIVPTESVTIEKKNKICHYYFEPSWVKKMIEDNLEYRKTNKIKRLYR